MTGIILSFLYIMNYILVFPTVVGFLQKPFKASIDILGPIGGMRYVTLVQLVFLGIIMLPLAFQMGRNLRCSQIIQNLYHNLRDPYIVVDIIIFETVILEIVIEIILWPCLWRPFLSNLPIRLLLNLLLLKVFALGLLVFYTINYIAVRLWLRNNRLLTLSCWIAGVLYYLVLGWVGYCIKSLPKVPFGGHVFIALIRWLYWIIEKGNEIFLLSAGLVIWTAIFFLGRRSMRKCLYKYGIPDEQSN